MSNRIYARKAIRCRYAGPGNVRGAAVLVDAEGDHRMRVPWDHALDAAGNMAAAARKLAEKLNWHGQWVMGACKDCYVFTLNDPDCSFIVERKV